MSAAAEAFPAINEPVEQLWRGLSLTFDLPGLRRPLKEPPRSPHPSLVVLDWDDTLLPSSYLLYHGVRPDAPSVIPVHVIETVSPLAPLVVSLLQKALACAPVYIITNASEGWVEWSCATFMPQVVPFLKHVTIVSARSQYETIFPQEPSEWKTHALFQAVSTVCGNGTYSRTPPTVLSIGDGMEERHAVLTVGTYLAARCTPKSIKLVETPSIEQMSRQLALLFDHFEDLARHDGPLDLHWA